MPVIQQGPALRGLPRIIASGTTAVASGATVNVVTYTRLANERVSTDGFITDNVATVDWAEDRAGLLVGLANGLGMFNERTANPNEAITRIVNSDVANGRTIDWMTFGTVP